MTNEQIKIIAEEELRRQHPELIDYEVQQAINDAEIKNRKNGVVMVAIRLPSAEPRVHIRVSE